MIALNSSSFHSQNFLSMKQFFIYFFCTLLIGEGRTRRKVVQKGLLYCGLAVFLAIGMTRLTGYR